MRKKIYRLAFLVLLAIVVAQARVYSKAVDEAVYTDSILLSALRQELARSTQLKLPDFDPPFFVSYTLRDEQRLVVQGTLGALTYSQLQSSRTCRARLLLGNRKQTNELFETRQSETERVLAIDTGVAELRRTLWLATDALYKNAAEEYANKQTALKQTNLPEDERSLYDFSEEVPLQMYIPNTVSMPHQAYWEDAVRKVSSVLARHPYLSASRVTFIASVSNVYFVNSEGAIMRQPVNYATFSISATLTQEDGRKISNRISFLEKEAAYLPSLDSMLLVSEQLAVQLHDVSKAPKFDDSYSGPVLVEGEALQRILTNELYQGTRSLIAHRDRVTGARSRTLDDKINKKILASSLTVKDMPSLQWYQGRHLVGAQVVDMEGVLPVTSSVLVHKGILKRLLNDRIPNKTMQASTGSARLLLDDEEISIASSPSVIKVEGEGGLSMDSLKYLLMTKARAEGYSHTYIIRSLGAYSRPFLIYRVNVETGSEELVQGSEWSQITLNSLKRVEAISSDIQVDNLVVGGAPSSIICPQAMILQDVDIDKERESAKYKAPLVQNPAKGQQMLKKDNSNKSRKKKK